jgi:hypothetical protein
MTQQIAIDTRSREIQAEVAGRNEKVEWVRRVLGVDFGSGSDTGSHDGANEKAKRLPMRARARPLGPPRYLSVQGIALWNAAVDDVLTQTESLADVLERADDPTLKDIAKACPDAVMKCLGAELVTALRDVDRVAPPHQEAARTAAQQIVKQYKDRIAVEPVFRLVDDNPYGVQISVRQTLIRALGTIDRQLKTSPVGNTGTSS